MTFEEFASGVVAILDTYSMAEVDALFAEIDWSKVSALEHDRQLVYTPDVIAIFEKRNRHRDEGRRLGELRQEKISELARRYRADVGDEVEKEQRRLQTSALSIYDFWIKKVSSKGFLSSGNVERAKAISTDDARKSLQSEKDRRDEQYKDQIKCYQHHGVIQDKQPDKKKTQKAEPYWHFLIDNISYEYWDYNDGERFQVGQEVYFNIHKDDFGYKIDGIMAARQPESRQVKNNAPLKAEVVSVKKTSNTIIRKRLPRREEKLEAAISHGALPAERGSSYLAWMNRNKDTAEVTSGKFDYKVFWVLFVLAKQYAKSECGEHLFSSGEDLENQGRALSELSDVECVKVAPLIKFTDSDFRKILNKPNCSSRRIEEIVERLGGIEVKFCNFEGLRFIDKVGNETWNKYSSVGQLFYITIEHQAKRKRGRGSLINEERHYTVYLRSTFALAFVHNLVLRGYTALPQKAFLKLSGKAQQLFIVSVWNQRKVIMKLEQGIKILGWQKPKDNNLSLIRKRFEDILDELKEAQFIKTWDVDVDVKDKYYFWPERRLLELR